MSTNPKIFIKRLIEKLNDKDLIIEQQKSFIQQQDKMLELAIDKLENGCCDAPESFDCDEVGMVCRDCWRKYLQGEVSK